MTKALIVAGTHSGCGKTLVSLALMALFVRKGYSVQAFKSGPDFIDPGHHATITGRSSHNVDGWMHGEAGVRRIVHQYTTRLPKAARPDIVILEGAMGLFDGASPIVETGSTAELAKWLGMPVLLVVDARSMARSAAAMVHGYTTLDRDVPFAGVVLNRVGSANHEELLTGAVQHTCPHIPLLGCLSRNEALSVPSRHLGLVTAEDGALSMQKQQAMADWIESHVDVEALYNSLPAMREEMQEYMADAGNDTPCSDGAVRIAVARDEAFCFYYAENLRLLEEAGAELIPFSPLRDATLPAGVHGLYLGGGYPELYANELAANEEMRNSIHSFATYSPVYAECGGFMYLMRRLHTEDSSYPMVGRFDFDCTMGKRFRALGYREIQTTQESLLGAAGSVVRGHEFHYSSIVYEAEQKTSGTADVDSDASHASLLYQVRDRKAERKHDEGYVKGNTIGSYVHLHFASNPQVAHAFVNACRTNNT